jgi:excisionase family DNA binding protein
MDAMNLQTPAKLAYSIPEAVAATAMSRAYIYAEIQARRLNATKIGSRTVILADDLRAWLHSHRTDAAA